jgi:hypothetical protein
VIAVAAGVADVDRLHAHGAGLGLKDHRGDVRGDDPGERGAAALAPADDRLSLA